jgi:hypothetical protein
MTFLKKILGAKTVPVRSYEDFWAWFVKHEKTFFRVVKNHDNIEKHFFGKLSPRLNELKDGFFYLTGMFDENTAELVITADGAVKNFVFVEELVAAAPEITGWKFTAHKPALQIKDVNIEMAGYQFSNEKLSFYPNESRQFPDEIDITIVHQDLNADNENAIINGTYIFLDNFLGEVNFATTIDTLHIVGKEKAAQELIAIDKLKSYLQWREKEFIEKYDGVRRNSENDQYSMLEGKLESGSRLFAVINTDLMEWDSKASHPWIVNVEMKFDGAVNGMPDDNTYKLLEEIEADILSELRDFEGNLNIGRQTAESIREVYFACKDFRKPSKVVHEIEKKYAGQLQISYSVYKDKYWQSFDRFMK